MRSRKPIRLCALALIAALAGPPPSLAYRMNVSAAGWQTSGPAVACNSLSGFDHWKTGTITWNLDISGMTAQQATNRAIALQQAVATWNGAGFDRQLVWGGAGSGTYRLHDGKNMMVWSTDPECNRRSCHAITAVYMERDLAVPTNGNVIIESDILFNASTDLGFQWMTNGQYSDNCWNTAGTQGLMIDTQGIATHELGHSLGISHTEKPSPPAVPLSSTVPTMGGIGCTTEARTLASDDTNALDCSATRYPYNPWYEGELQVVNCREISGWAWNRNATWQQSYVEITDIFPTSETAYAVVKANYYTGGQHGYHYFRYVPDSGYFTGQWYTVGARYTGTGEALAGSPKPIICAASIFEQASPVENLPTGGQVYTVGTQFSSNRDGYITQLGFHRASEETGTNTLRLWDDYGNELANVPASCSSSGWCWGWISPVYISAGTRYRVSVNTNTRQSKTGCGIGSGITNDPLTAHSGYWIAGDAFPTNGSCSNFFVDVRFDL